MAEQQYVVLPTKVENLIESICKKQKQQPPDTSVRQQLKGIGEEKAVEILEHIAGATIRRSLSAYIVHMLKQYKPQPQPPPSPPVSLSPSPSRNGTVSPPSPHSPLLFAALGDLEFRKAFLLLSYIGRASLKDVTTVEYIRSIKDLSMAAFENKIWNDLGKKLTSDRQWCGDWDSGKTHVYHCHVSLDGSLRFKGPILQSMRTHLQKSLGDDNVLLVKFAEDKNAGNTGIKAKETSALYRKFGKEGIRVGLRLYRFFVFKDGGKEEKKKDPTTSSVKCYFVRMESYCSIDASASYILSNKTMSEARTLFMHVHTLSSLDKYMARFSLILSKTLKLSIDFANLRVETIDDLQCMDENGNMLYDNGKPRILTDGTGFISEDLALLCPKNVFRGGNLENKYIQEICDLVQLEDISKGMGEANLSTHQPPLLIQCRLFHNGRAIKGTLLVKRKLPPRTIQVRPSMIKVHTDPKLQNTESLNSMEVVTTSNKPNRAYLCKSLIALLSYGGVPNEYFKSILRSNFEEADRIFSSKHAALRALINHGEMDDYNAAEMILCGIPIDEPVLQRRLSIIAKEERNKLKGGKLYVPDCFYLIGTVDPTESLERNQVCIIHENGQITGDVLVYRHPGLHFGDIHIMKAKHVDGLESYVGHSKYAIFFPCVGPRSVADEIGGGDFDGDMYWVSKNPQLLQYFRQSDPWMENSVSLDADSREPSAFSAEELEEELFNLYMETRFQPSHTMGVAADSWLALMDRLLTLRNDRTKENEIKHLKENILKLIDIYYVALDAPKKGGKKIRVPDDLAVEMYPHYMEKDRSFTSKSILGLIYDEVCRWQTVDKSGTEIRKLPCFDIQIPESCIQKWKPLYEQYRKDMTSALGNVDAKNEAADEVIKIYKKELYGASQMVDSPKSMRDIYNEALAVYHVTYDYAIKWNSVSKCEFAWKVAGPALTSLYALKQSQKPLNCSPLVLREIFYSSHT